MRSLFLILSDIAQVVEGKLYMLGGAWNQLTTTTLPTNRSYSIAIGLEPDPEEFGQRHTLRLALAHAGDGIETEVGHGEFQIGALADAQEQIGPRVVAALPVTLSLHQTGLFHVKLYVNGSELDLVPFSLEHRPK